MTFSKQALLDRLISTLEADLRSLTQSAREAHAAATHEEGRAEDQYDTRGLEASYLAGAQAKRAAELQKKIQLYRNLELRNFSTESHLAVTALVELECEGKRSWVFLVPGAGGTTLALEGRSIQIISTTSPLGEELVGRRFSARDEREFEVELSPALTRDYRIVSVQ